MERRVAVVIPTRGNKPDRLAAALESIAAQDVDAEIFVAGPPQVPADASAAAKRNAGWRATEAPLVAFTDDDCRAAPGWLAALLDAAGDSDDVVVQGRTEPDPEEIRNLWGLAHSQTIVGDSPWHETCNIAYPRELLERLGGFDEGFADYGGEDTDLALRAIALGAGKVYAEDALVWHAVELRRPAALLRRTGWRDFGLVFKRHPEQRRHLYAGLFISPYHGRAVLLLAGLLTRRPLLAAAAALPYAELHLSHYRRSPLSLLRAAAQLPFRALGDLAEVATMARSSLRHRTLVL